MNDIVWLHYFEGGASGGKTDGPTRIWRYRRSSGGAVWAAATNLDSISRSNPSAFSGEQLPAGITFVFGLSAGEASRR